MAALIVWIGKSVRLAKAQESPFFYQKNSVLQLIKMRHMSPVKNLVIKWHVLPRKPHLSSLTLNMSTTKLFPIICRITIKRRRKTVFNLLQAFTQPAPRQSSTLLSKSMTIICIMLQIQS